MGFKAWSNGIWGWWAFDVFTLIASYMGSSDISAQTILRQMGLITFMIPVGIGQAIGTLVGNYIGQGCEASITYFYKMALWMAAIYAAITVTLLVVF